MKANDKYIYLKDENDRARLHQVKYNSSNINKMINEYSLESGANIVEKKFLGSISSYENGRIISKEVKHFEESNKTLGLTLNNRTIYSYKIIENESDFIKSIINSFNTYSLTYLKPYVLVNFSEVYNMVMDNKLNEQDIKFFMSILNEITIIPAPWSMIYNTLPQGAGNKNEDSIKNSYVFDMLKCQNLNNKNNVGPILNKTLKK